ncbi:hypothetical protein MRB53_039810 [Persea americana]|nr:hypothetical protein MRB53_039810 [Persea americana]
MFPLSSPAISVTSTGEVKPSQAKVTIPPAQTTKSQGQNARPDLGRSVNTNLPGSTLSRIGSTPATPTVDDAATPTAARGSNHNSAVMTETLSVIDEHMMNMGKSPTLGVERATMSQDRRGSSAHSGSEYSNRRASFVANTDTEEEEHTHTRAEVMTWTPAAVAKYLADVGVEKSHCTVFLEQEFSGEVLLGMDQSSIFLKELELGAIGRRLKTWQKIKALQDEIKYAPAPDAKQKKTQMPPMGHSSRSSGPSSPNFSRRTSAADFRQAQAQAQAQSGQREPGMPSTQASRPA